MDGVEFGPSIGEFEKGKVNQEVDSEVDEGLLEQLHWVRCLFEGTTATGFL
jgi:hypothetical protein